MLGVLAPLPREVARVELLDEPGVAPEELAGNLADIARLNRLGPTRALLTRLEPFLARHRDGAPFRVLDLGTGAADIPAAIVRWARARSRRVSVTALDLRPDVLAWARHAARELPEIRLVAGNALHPPVRPGGVDLVLCSLTLHHLPEAAVVRLLALMADLGRLGFVVSDLHRSRTAYVAAWLTTRLISRNRVTRHDGPLSVHRAYTRAELERLAAVAHVPGIRWHRVPGFRVVGVYRRDGER